MYLHVGREGHSVLTKVDLLGILVLQKNIRTGTFNNTIMLQALHSTWIVRMVDGLGSISTPSLERASSVSTSTCSISTVSTPHLLGHPTPRYTSKSLKQVKRIQVLRTT